MNTNNIQFFRLTSFEVEDSCKLLIEVMKNLEYYKGWKEEELYDYFREVYDYCITEGEIWGAFDNGELIGVGMWFEYKKGDKAHYVLDSELKDGIDNILSDPESKVIYKPFLAILPKYQKRGIATELLKELYGTKFAIHFMTYGINPSWSKKLKEKGWSKVADCKGYEILMK